MAALAGLQPAAQALIQEYFSKCRLAEERRALEQKAIVTIQSWARGFLVRRRLQRLTWTALTVQRYWRGYLGRLRGRLALEVQNRALRRAYFNAMATIIQRWWRGFYSRKHIHDYYARKRYLHDIKQRNDHIRAELSLETERAIIAQRQEAEERARRLFAEKVSKLHHLVSTGTQPGIFNSPYAIATGTLPVIMGLPVEEHLKSAMRAQVLATQAGGGSPGATAGSPSRRAGGAASGGGAQGGKLLPPLRAGSGGRSGPRVAGQRVGDAAVYPATVEVAGKVVPARQTLRQVADYNAVHRESLLEDKIHRAEMLSQHPQAFATALGPVKQPAFDLQTNRNLSPFVDTYDPTVGLRGPRFTPDQQRVSKSAFSRYVKKQPMFDKNMAAEAY
ncbi:hypothetical protein HYH03_016208 [Edaphochlamys debaryana]|uniref:Spermatogenesis-associated protein 17 n=1 Tax=Edaphochlamys debaryana TaxID=47281 RepID=A0A836BQC9_9CHLO|nr:hypothetical protein HYH03_016208 [Edaphochlamys debaryana]|eukprot:KAG2485005.1 hypothetical protein HYH03_016208 [Edaphochlamys debaryana]